jgi:hypothetical protein
MFTIRHHLCWLIVPLLPVLLWGACGEEPFIDNESGTPRPCESDCDCYSGYNYELGTRCIDGLCLCPVSGHAPTPCCKKDATEFDCDRQCRPASECFDPDGGASSGGSGGGGAGSNAGCTSAKDCKAPGDPRCSDVQCEDGACRVTLKPLGKLASQIRGDCVSSYCDGAGNVVSLPDGEDVYNDGKQCTIDLCKDGKAVSMPYPDGSTCPETGSGVCFDRGCVACIESLILCDEGFACDYTSCVPMHCVNGIKEKNLGETDNDCGGPCVPCPTGDWCTVGSDCADGVCSGQNCQPSSCSDGVTNDHETAVDCGGPPSCPRCAPGKTCQKGDDCLSGVCWVGLCEPPKCDDGIKNGDEVGVDCGGACQACP